MLISFGTTWKSIYKISNDVRDWELAFSTPLILIETGINKDIWFTAMTAFKINRCIFKTSVCSRIELKLFGFGLIFDTNRRIK